jgi:release factor glutamine methyltransferase
MLKGQDVYSLLRTAEIFLKKKGIPEAKIDAEVLLSFVLKIKRSKLPLIRNQQLEDHQVLQYKEYILRRSKREPTSYITGFAGFMYFEFKVNKDVLIPRCETEILVEHILKLASQENKSSVLDLCTGCGCIAVSLAKLGNFKNIVASDINVNALGIAKENAKINSVDNINFLESNIFDGIGNTKFDIIASNPPYISYEEYGALAQELKYEPKDALVAEDNGLFFYKKIAIDAKKYLTSSGVIFLELNANKVAEIKQIFLDSNYSNIEIINDYAGLPRILRAGSG